MPPLLADFTHARVCKPFCEKFLTLPRSLIVHYRLPSGLLRQDLPSLRPVLKNPKKNKILGFPKDFVAELVSPPGLEPGASGLGVRRTIS